MDMPKILTDTARPGIYRSCRARSLIDSAPLDAETRAGVWAYIDADPHAPGTTPAPALSKYLVSRGIPLSMDAIRRHRRRECACPEPKDNA